MHVLMVTNMYPSEAFPSRGIFIKSQIDSIVNKGIDVDLLFIDAWKSRSAYIKAIAELRKKIRNRAYDIIHAHYGFSGLIARTQFQVPLIVSFCGGDVLGNPDEKGKKTLSSRLYTVFSQLLSIVTPAVIVKSEEMKRKLMQTNNVFVIPNGVDFDMFTPIPKTEARKKLGLDLKKKYVLFPSNANWVRKGYELARSSVDALDGAFDVQLITLFGQKPEYVPLYMNACDAVIMTSLWEGSPNVIKEAMACNVPVVSSDVGDVKQIMSGCPGCFLARMTADDFSRKLHRVLSTDRRTTGRSHIVHLEISRVADEIIRLYARLRSRRHHKRLGAC